MTDRAGAAVAAIVQARMSSSRLRGKVLAELWDGRRTLDLVIERLGRCRELAAVALATSDGPSDDPVAEHASGLGVTVVRGPLDDVLERYRLATERVGCDAVVRITADCPFVDPGIVDRLVGIWREGLADYVTNVLEPRSFPKGLDAEVVSVQALRSAAAETTDPYDREHVTPFVRTRPERFPAEGLWLEPGRPEERVTLDTQDDLAALRALLGRLGPAAELTELLPTLGVAEWRLVRSPP